MVRQREELKMPVDDMNEVMECANRELLGNSDITRARLASGELVKCVSVPTFAAQTVHGPEGITLQAIESVTGCMDVIMEIEGGTKEHNPTIHAKEGEAGRIDWAENMITIIVVEQTRGATKYVQSIFKEAL